MYVPVVSSSKKPLMPCHPARARQLIKQGKALKRFNRGIFYIQLTERKDGDVQSVVVGIDPGSKKEGYTVKSALCTYLNIQADAVTWVRDHVKTRRIMRRSRRNRKTPCRKNRFNRSIGGIPPSIKSRWQWKLRLCSWLSKLFPVSHFVVEDIKARTKGSYRWDVSFSPLEVGKKWFYAQLKLLGSVLKVQGWETKQLREELGLKKISNKKAVVFSAHYVDSWVLANKVTGGHIKPDNETLICIVPLRFHRRQLHRLRPQKHGRRSFYGSTCSLGFKRGSLIKHPKWGVCYVGRFYKDRLSLHSLTTGNRIARTAKPRDCQFLTYNTWRQGSSLA